MGPLSRSRMRGPGLPTHSSNRPRHRRCPHPDRIRVGRYTATRPSAYRKHAIARAQLREDAVNMQLRVVADQPWDVQADVLVVPIVGEPAFSGPFDEIDRRSGGELRELATFRELRTKRYSSALAAAGELPVRRIVTVAVGDGETVDREVVVRVASAAIRRLAGRQVSRVAFWLTPLAGVLDGGAEVVAELVARGGGQ